MVEETLKRQISEDFNFLKSHLQGILLFGSYTDDSYTIRSDIDICLVAGGKNVKEIFNMFLAEDVTEKYDIKIFETLPLYMKAEVLENAVVVWADDAPEMSYYLYRWRRLIDDQLRIRQQITA
ncbi:MAG: nucleotidyltransferase domain-containing protein [Methanosarcinales archaeon]|nr:MAG: nucleotidyltransferase domain-containing protein [Methanosarcinales archaeon]